MMSHRPYRTALATQQIDAILADGAGKQWDPFVVEHFMACRADIYPLCRTTTINAAAPDVGRMAVAAWNVDSSAVIPARGTDEAAMAPEKLCVGACR
jgi:hypothetical protein